ncbi:N-acyl homoserine lactonase family protein [Nocardioides cynanchi]|uniref:N-acyl homoserine lactonase family protein n=1 Tax=Nocardioides cynanchi TaxID=2558918 RepID=UPI001EE36654|nr:N-acyl homoserine lactonase family protein [Nocardioides cynanchi]
MTTSTSSRSEAISVTRIRVGDLLAGDERMPINVHLIDHPDGRILVDTGLTRLHPEAADMDPRIQPWYEPPAFDVDSIDIVVNTHLHYDHVGGNHLFAGKPIYVQRREFEEAHAVDHTILEWVDAPGVSYTQIDGDCELLPGVRLLSAPGHTDGSQIVVIDSGPRPTVICGDTAVFYHQLDEPVSDGQRLIRSLDPEAVWLSHVDQPWQPPR